MLSRAIQFGFTLIEIMIAIVIMGILMSAAVPSFSKWMQNSQIRTAAESVQNGLQLARAEAARANTSVSFTLAGNDWSVAVSGVASAVQARSGQEGSPNAVITSVNSVTISGVATAMSGQNIVWFNGTGRLTGPPPAATPIVGTAFSVTNPKAGACTPLGGSGGARCLTVIVSTGGKVRMCDPALPATNPQGC